jgi:hypothetical protein
MTKVKILSANFPDVLERMINDFALKRDVLNVRFSTAAANHTVYYSAMIIYEEDHRADR